MRKPFIVFIIFIQAFAISVKSQITDSISKNRDTEAKMEEIWEQIDLVSEKMKPNKKAFPYWIPISVLGGGGLMYLLLEKKDSINEVKDTVCNIKLEHTIVSENCKDSNGEVRIIINNPFDYNFLWNTGVTTPNLLGVPRGDYSLVVTSANNPLCTKTYNFTITGIDYTLLPVDDTYQITTDEEISDNIFSNDIGTEISLNGFTEIAEAEIFTIDSQGNLYFKPSEKTGEFRSTYQITDACMSIAEANIFFIVTAAPCEFTVATEGSNADCGKANGREKVLINPSEGDYQILWSNGESGYEATSLSAGDNSVTITDSNTGCIKEINFTTGENPPSDLIVRLESFPATFIGGGGISFEIAAEKLVSIEVSLEGNVKFSSNLEPGIHQLLDVQTFVPGTYLIRSIEMGCPERCATEKIFSIAEIPLSMTLADDEFTTPQGVDLIGNVPLNDDGVGLRIGTYTEAPGGTINISESGDFTFQPEPQFTGDYTIKYTAIDTCGQSKGAELKITVQKAPCEYTATFSIILPDCGMQNGSVTAVIQPPDMLILTWSNGQQGNIMTDIGKGIYELQIYNPVTQCKQVFSVEVDELPATYIIGISSSPPTCNTPATIVIELVSPGSYLGLFIGPFGNQFEILLSGGSNAFSNLSPGVWTVIVQNLMSGPDCFEAESFLVEEYKPITLSLVSATPPSSPVAMDGVIVLNLSGSNPPFNIFANEFVFGPFQPGQITLSGLYSGVWEIIAIDLTEECFSNVLVVPLIAGAQPPQNYFHFSPSDDAPQVASSMFGNFAKENFLGNKWSYLLHSSPISMSYEISITPRSSYLIQGSYTYGRLNDGNILYSWNLSSAGISYRKYFTNNKFHFYTDVGMIALHNREYLATPNLYSTESTIGAFHLASGFIIEISNYLSLTNRLSLLLGNDKAVLNSFIGMVHRF